MKTSQVVQTVRGWADAHSRIVLVSVAAVVVAGSLALTARDAL